MLCKKYNLTTIRYGFIKINFLYLSKQNVILNLKTKTMKKLLLFILVISVISCHKDDNEPKKPIDLLPEATHTGANTAGCLVDGEAIYPKGFGNTLQIYYDGLRFTLSFGYKKDGVDKTINMASLNQSIVVGETYLLEDYGDGENTKFGEYFISYPDFSGDTFRTTETITGELTITHHDYDNAFLSGTFWFNAINSEGKIVKITEGRFDAEY